MGNKVIEYLITAKDKTAAALKSAVQNVKNYANAVKNTGEEAKKASQEAVNAFNPMDAIFNAASGNIDGVAKQIAGLIGRIKMLHMSMMTIGLFGALIAVLVKAFKAWNDAIIDAAKSASEMKNSKFDQYMKQLADEQARYNKELERTNKALQDERQHEDALAEAAKNRKLAQLEIERQTALAEGGNADEINERFAQSKAEIESGFASRSGTKSVERLKDDINSAYDEIDKYRADIEDLKKMARTQIKVAGRRYTDSVGSTWNKDEYNEMMKGHAERAENALKQIQDYQDKIADIEQTIKQKENQIEQINANTGVRALEERAGQMERDNAVEDRLKKEEETRAKEIEDYFDALEKWQEEQEKMMLDALAQEESARMAMVEREHRERLANQQKEIQEAQRQQQQASTRLQAAQQATATAWGWYRDKSYDGMHASIEMQKREAAAEASFQKDFDRLKRTKGRDWRTLDFGKLSDDQEAVRQVALAREEEAKAARWAEETASNTAYLQQIYEQMQGEE